MVPEPGEHVLEDSRIQGVVDLLAVAPAVDQSASLRTAKWCDIDGLVMSNDDANSPAVRSPPDNSRRISRRVGSDKALKTAL